MILSRAIRERNIEVVDLNNLARNRRFRSRRYRRAHRFRAARKQETLLEIHRLVAPPHSGKIACSRVAFCASACALEIGASHLSVARQDIRRRSWIAIPGGCFQLLLQEMSEISHLAGAECSIVRWKALERWT